MLRIGCCVSCIYMHQVCTILELKKSDFLCRCAPFITVIAIIYTKTNQFFIVLCMVDSQRMYKMWTRITNWGCMNTTKYNKYTFGLLIYIIIQYTPAPCICVYSISAWCIIVHLQLNRFFQ